MAAWLRACARRGHAVGGADGFGRRKMVLETRQHPGALKDQVQARAPHRGIHELEKGGLRATS